MNRAGLAGSYGLDFLEVDAFGNMRPNTPSGFHQLASLLQPGRDPLKVAEVMMREAAGRPTSPSDHAAPSGLW